MTSLEECFDSFIATAFRLEAKPSYVVAGETERMEAFQRGEPRPERSVRTSPWLARIAVTTVSAGKRWQRVTVLAVPLTGYQRYRITGLIESQAAGEEILIAPARLFANVHDFWLFDAGMASARLAVLRYDDQGRYLGVDITANDKAIAEHTAARDLAVAHSLPLNRWLAVAGKASAAA